MGDRFSAQRCLKQARAIEPGNVQGPQLTYQFICSSVMSDPTFAEGWTEIGHANANLKAVHGAIGAYRRALECEDDYLTPEKRGQILTSMAHMLQQLGRMDEARECLGKALEINKSDALAWLNMSLCMAADGYLDVSLAAAKTAYGLLPDKPEVGMGLALAHLFAGNYAEGFKYFEARFPYKLNSFLSYPFPKWDGAARTVYLVADQGIGDTLSFARFVPLAAKRAKFLHIAVQPELLRLLSASFQNLPNISITPLPQPLPPAEAWSTFVSLPYVLGLSDDDIRDMPNIRMPPFAAPSLQWKSADRVLHIGVAWAGSVANDIDHWRSFPLHHLLELYRVPGIQLYSLQVGDKAMELHAAGCATLLRDLSPFIRDVSDTIGILNHLDLVIGCESALGHICAAANKEFWMPYSYYGRDFRTGFDGSNRLWSPRHRVFKQDKDARWENVFERIVEALRERVASVAEAA